MKRISLAVFFWTAISSAPGQTAAPAAIALGGYTQSLQAPARVATDSAGKVYVTEPQAGRVVVFDTFGRQVATPRVYARVPQTAARGIVPGQAAELLVPELPARVFPAKVARTAGAMDAQSRTLLTELEVDNARGEILAGTYAQVRFPNVKLDAVLTLPSNTLLFRAEGPQVGVVSPDGKVELRRVTLGRDFGPTVEILDGLKSTDRVIVNPADSLVSGITVRIAETPAQK